MIPVRFLHIVWNIFPALLETLNSCSFEEEQLGILPKHRLVRKTSIHSELTRTLDSGVSCFPIFTRRLDTGIRKNRRIGVSCQFLARDFIRI
jgi:hypothetical protein